MKRGAGMDNNLIEEMQPDEFPQLIRVAAEQMVLQKAFIWGCSTSTNIRSLWNWGISRKLGIVNGYFYGFRVRHDAPVYPLLGSATEDVERSLRYYVNDGVLLRFRFLTAKTKCYDNAGGLQDSCGNRTIFYFYFFGE